MKRKLCSLTIVTTLLCSLFIWLGQTQAVNAETNNVENVNIVKILENLSAKGYMLKNKASGRMMNLKGGSTKDGAVFDTYDHIANMKKDTNPQTELFKLKTTNNGLQILNFCSSTKKVDVTTNKTGQPKVNHKIGLYTTTTPDDGCSYWIIHLVSISKSGILITIESQKGRGCYIGHPTTDPNGTKRESLVLRNDPGNEACQWYIYDYSKEQQITEDSEVVKECTDCSGKEVIYNNGNIAIDKESKKQKIDLFLEAIRNNTESLGIKTNGDSFIGYLTYNGKECTEHYKKDSVTGKTNSNGCSNCQTSYILQAGWFQVMTGYLYKSWEFPSSFNNDTNAYNKSITHFLCPAADNRSCVAFAKFLADWLIRTSDEDVTISTINGTRPEGKMGKSFCEKNNIDTGDVLLFKKSNGDIEHCVFVYDRSGNNLTIVEANNSFDRARYGHCYIRKNTVNINSYYNGTTVQLWRFRVE